MSKRKTAVGLAVLFALALSAFGASSASAATEGTTAFTCVKDPNGTHLGAHCLTSGTDKYKHVAFTGTTTGTATNANTTSETTAARSAILRAPLSGVNTEVTCGEVHAEGSVTNTLVGEVHRATANGRLHYTKCVVKAPAEKGCKVAGETITTEPVVGTALTTTAKIEPEAGTKFASIKIEGCSIEALNNTFPVEGSLEAQINGATLTSTHAEVTAQGKLKFGGQKAGLDGALTIKAHLKDGEETKPIVTTKPPYNQD